MADGRGETRVFDLTLTGQLALDFANTVDWRTSDQPKELINSYADLARWSQHTGLFTEREARRLTREAARRPEEASAVLERAIALREALFRIFSAAAGGSRPHKADLDYLNGELSDVLSRLRIIPTAEGYAWEWAAGEDDLDRMLWAVVRAAGELLTSDDPDNLRECAGAGCAWLFMDTSRNKSRRWCDMGVCGNRAKARRHYEQVKASG